MMEKILYKKWYYDLWEKGELGNKFRSWRDLDEFNASGYRGLTSIRYLHSMFLGATYGVPAKDVGNTCLKLVASSPIRLDPGLFIFNEAAPDERLLIQGELYESPSGLYLYYSCLPDRMRIALAKDGRGVERSAAKMVLDRYLDTNSLDDIRLLLDKYPEHIIEFSTYAFDVGNIPNRNTVIWEVRAY